MWAASVWTERGTASHAAADIEWLDRRLALLERRAESARKQRSGQQPVGAATQRRKRWQFERAATHGTDASQYDQPSERRQQRASGAVSATYGGAALSMPPPPRQPPHALALSSLSAFQLDRLLLAYSNSLVSSSERLFPTDAVPAASGVPLVVSLSSLNAAIASVRQQRALEERQARKERLMAAMIHDRSGLLERQQQALESERRARREEQSRVQQRRGAVEASDGRAHGDLSLKRQLRQETRDESTHANDAHRQSHWTNEERRHADHYRSMRAHRETVEAQLLGGAVRPLDRQLARPAQPHFGDDSKLSPDLTQRPRAARLGGEGDSALSGELPSTQPPAPPHTVKEHRGSTVDYVQRDVETTSQQQPHHDDNKQLSVNELLSTAQSDTCSDADMQKNPGARTANNQREGRTVSPQQQQQQPQQQLTQPAAEEATVNEAEFEEQEPHGAVEAEEECGEAIEPTVQPSVELLSVADRRCAIAKHDGEQRGHLDDLTPNGTVGNHGSVGSGDKSGSAAISQFQVSSSQPARVGGHSEPVDSSLGARRLSATRSQPQPQHSQRPQLEPHSQPSTEHVEAQHNATQGSSQLHAEMAERAVRAGVNENNAATAAARHTRQSGMDQPQNNTGSGATEAEKSNKVRRQTHTLPPSRPPSRSIEPTAPHLHSLCDASAGQPRCAQSASYNAHRARCWYVRPVMNCRRFPPSSTSPLPRTRRSQHRQPHRSSLSPLL